MVVLAAGIGSRFGGVKQLQPVGPQGQVILDYAVESAIRAGFTKVVFLIRHAIEADFRAVVGDRAEALCRRHGVKVSYAFQELDDLPAGYRCPAHRTRPWGTGQAIRACRNVVREPFVVCNADDFYGFEAYRLCLNHLQKEESWCLAGFRLGNTLSCHGGVTRGVCRVSDDGSLLAVHETRGVQTTENGIEAEGRILDPDAVVSMNMWGFTPALFDALDELFPRFLTENGLEKDKEFLLPVAVDALLQQGKAAVRVLPTDAAWYGITYAEDLPLIRAALL